MPWSDTRSARTANPPVSRPRPLCGTGSATPRPHDAKHKPGTRFAVPRQAFYDTVAALPRLQSYLQNQPPVYYKVCVCVCRAHARARARAAVPCRAGRQQRPPPACWLSARCPAPASPLARRVPRTALIAVPCVPAVRGVPLIAVACLRAVRGSPARDGRHGEPRRARARAGCRRAVAARHGGPVGDARHRLRQREAQPVGAAHPAATRRAVELFPGPPAQRRPRRVGHDVWLSRAEGRGRPGHRRACLTRRHCGRGLLARRGLGLVSCIFSRSLFACPPSPLRSTRTVLAFGHRNA